ncbi:MAG TPA: class I SAM-dependent methyltransferase [Mycobacteriales bacterium]|nr:class I SAM-dependent methyltransferase [Mycobacteriales bacterium]
MIYQHPLAYLLGVEGLALLRAWAGDYDEAFVRARLAEVRRLLDEPVLADHAGVAVRHGDLPGAYRRWSATYDAPRNSLFDSDEPVTQEILEALPTGTILDAACGTGRYAAYLAAQGHRVLGLDSSPEMLDRARVRVPEGTFLRGDLDRLPVADGAVDVVVCALALVHVPTLAPVMAEFARVLRPGGHLVVSDVHRDLVMLGSVVHSPGPAGEPGLAPTYRHSTGDYLRAALPVGLRVRRCEEPRPTLPDEPAAPPEEITVGQWADWPWSLLPLIPAATRAAWDKASTTVWHFQLDHS